jgi:hypothetical protein
VFSNKFWWRRRKRDPFFHRRLGLAIKQVVPG